MKNLVSVFRACGNETVPSKFRSCRPEWFDKFRCWKSFHDSFSLSDIIVVWDGPRNALYDYISTFKSVNIYESRTNSNKGSLDYCLSFVNQLQDSYKFFYLIEDDHLHERNACKVLLEGLNKFSPNFVTTGDHLDRYRYNNGDIINSPEIYLTDSAHWKIVESYVFSFAFSSETLKKHYATMKHYNDSGDGAVADREFFRHMVGKQQYLLSPLPGLSTHCVKNDCVFLEKWKKVNDSICL